MQSTDMQSIRRAYAEELRAVSDLRSEALVNAFASVPREHYLGPGPWQIAAPAALGKLHYRTTADADPRHLYHNVLVAIDANRGLNNGQPSALAFWFDAFDLKTGERVVHIGCGVGYFTAILAEVVQASGRVTGIEVDAELAARARNNLAHMPQVTIITGDGGTIHAESVDAIFVNAGATHPRAEWLNALRLGGRLLLPLTYTADSLDQSSGGMLKVTRTQRGFDARFISRVGIFPCVGARDPQLNEQLADAIRADSLERVKTPRVDVHQRGESCWLHGEHFCLSMLPPVNYDATVA